MSWVKGEEVKEKIKYKGYLIEHFFYGSMNMWRIKESSGLFSPWKRIGEFGSEQKCKDYIDSIKK